MNFINDVLNGKVYIEDIDNYIKDYENNMYDYEIYEFLGLTENEYETWLQSGDEYLLEVIYKRKIYRDNIDFWRNNPDKFIEEALGIKLYSYQKLMLKGLHKNKKWENKSLILFIKRRKICLNMKNNMIFIYI